MNSHPVLDLVNSSLEDAARVIYVSQMEELSKMNPCCANVSSLLIAELVVSVRFDARRKMMNLTRDNFLKAFDPKFYPFSRVLLNTPDVVIFEICEFLGNDLDVPLWWDPEVEQVSRNRLRRQFRTRAQKRKLFEMTGEENFEF